MGEIQLPKPRFISPEDCPYPNNQQVRYDAENGEVKVCTGCEFLKYNMMNDRWTCIQLPELIEFQKEKKWREKGEIIRKFKRRFRYRVGY